MREKPAKKKDGRKRPAGAEPEHLSLYRFTFDEAIKRALAKKRPPGGWPARQRRRYLRKKPANPGPS